MPDYKQQNIISMFVLQPTEELEANHTKLLPIDYYGYNVASILITEQLPC